MDAGRKYKKALRYYNWMTKQDLLDTSDNTMTDLKMIVLLNLAAVKLRDKNHRDTMKHCNEVSKHSSKRVKQFISRF